MTVPTLHVLQSLWGMERLPGDAAEWSLTERFARIRAAGFDGISAHFDRAEEVASWIGAAHDHGFVIEGAAFPHDVEDLRPALELAARHGIHHLVVQGMSRPARIEQGLERLDGWLRLGREFGVSVLVETHRNTLTTDLWTLCELLDRRPGLPLLADLAHYVVGQEIHLPMATPYAAAIERVLGNARAFHGRIASSQQSQVEIGFAIHRPWVEQFLAWWERGFVRWLERAAPAQSLTFSCELGPPPYAITGPDGRERADRWVDAQHLRELVLACWARAVARHAATLPAEAGACF